MKIIKKTTVTELIGIGIIIFGAIKWLSNVGNGYVIAVAKDFILIGIFVYLGGYFIKKYSKEEKNTDDDILDQF